MTAIVYPPICLHCRDYAPIKRPQLCLSCLEHLTLIDPLERCPFCFRTRCACLSLLKYHFDGVGACFDHYGPPLSLLRRMRSRKKSYLAKMLASFILVQWERLGWPVPDYVVPVPTKPFHTPFSIKEITYYVSHLFHLPKRNLIKKGLLPENGLYKAKGKFTDKTLLLIQDALSPPEEIDAMGQALLKQTPKAIYLHAFVDSQ